MIVASTPIAARAFATNLGSALLMHAVFADTGKVLQLFSEVMLGVWSIGLAAALRVQASRWLLGVLGLTGAYAVLVAGVKSVDPYNGLEDSLALLPAVTGVHPVVLHLKRVLLPVLTTWLRERVQFVQADMAGVWEAIRSL